MNDDFKQGAGLALREIADTVGSVVEPMGYGFALVIFDVMHGTGNALCAGGGTDKGTLRVVLEKCAAQLTAGPPSSASKELDALLSEWRTHARSWLRTLPRAERNLVIAIVNGLEEIATRHAREVDDMRAARTARADC